jgi:hypothetical protein
MAEQVRVVALLETPAPPQTEERSETPKPPVDSDWG